MKIRRVQSGGNQVIEVFGERGWTALSSSITGEQADLVQTLRKHPPLSSTGPDGVILPFQPLSYRDFMLYERHYIQAARGYLRRFRPSAARLARAFEAVTRRTFPPLRPSRLWYREPIYYMGNHVVFVSDGAEIPWPGLANGEENIFPDPASQMAADGWRDGVADALEREFGAFVPPGAAKSG